MLDTNAVRSLLNAAPLFVARMARHQAADCSLSVVTEAEMLFGLARNPGAVKLRERISAALATFDVLPWTRSTAATYAKLRAHQEQRGKPLAPLDMMIAAHALEQSLVLVTSDRALLEAAFVKTEDWLAP